MGKLCENKDKILTILASEGYLWEMLQRDPIDVEKMEKDFTDMINFWKSIYLRKEV